MPLKRCHAVSAPAIIGGQYDLRVAPGAEGISFVAQFFFYLDVIVHFAVINDRVFPVIRHGLVSVRRQIDDGEPSVAEGEALTEKITLIIGAAVGDQIVHRLDIGAVDGLIISVNYSAYAAHGLNSKFQCPKRKPFRSSSVGVQYDLNRSRIEPLRSVLVIWSFALTIITLDGFS